LSFSARQVGQTIQSRISSRYAEDLDALRSHLSENGINAGAIVDGTPGPKREMTLIDPDGYCLMIAEID